MFSNIKRSNERTETLASYKDVVLRVDYFWNDRGDLTSLSDSIEIPTYWPKANVQICKYSYTENLFGENFDFEVKQLIVNGEIIPGDVVSYKEKTNFEGKPMIECKLTIGWS